MIFIVIPSFNEKKYIKNLLNDLLIQTFEDFKIIISDNGSTDGTIEYLKKNKEVISLNLINRKIEKEQRQSWALGIENKRRASLNLEIFDSYKAMEDFNDTKETKDNENEFDIDVDNDYLLNEGTQILSDYAIFNESIYLSKAA